MEFIGHLFHKKAILKNLSSSSKRYTKDVEWPVRNHEPFRFVQLPSPTVPDNITNRLINGVNELFFSSLDSALCQKGVDNAIWYDISKNCLPRIDAVFSLDETVRRKGVVYFTSVTTSNLLCIPQFGSKYIQ